LFNPIEEAQKAHQKFIDEDVVEVVVNFYEEVENNRRRRMIIKIG
jgi:hypothetical protein